MVAIGSLEKVHMMWARTDDGTYHIESKFDKVFLLEDFNSTLYQVK